MKILVCLFSCQFGTFLFVKYADNHANSAFNECGWCRNSSVRSINQTISEASCSRTLSEVEFIHQVNYKPSEDLSSPCWTMTSPPLINTYIPDGTAVESLTSLLYKLRTV